jgi:hypothetical protein
MRRFLLLVTLVSFGCATPDSEDIVTTRGALQVPCTGSWSVYAQTDGYHYACFNSSHDASTSTFVPNGEYIVDLFSNVTPMHVWMCDHERAGGGVPQPWPFYAPGFVTQTTGKCYRTDGVTSTFHREFLPGLVIKSILVANEWTQKAPACVPPGPNDSYVDCNSTSDSGLPNVVATRFGSVISGTWPDGSSGAPCTGLRVRPPGDQGTLSTFVGSACPSY